MSEKDVSTDCPSLGELMDDDEVIQQKAWQFIRQLNSQSDELLDAPALVGGGRTYTYRQMFKMWDCYAEVFSALGITGENHARVVLLGSSSVEPIFALYALNMCGASVSLTMMMDFMNAEGLERMVAEEHITDIVVPDYSMPRDFFRHLMAHKEQMSIRNIVILPTTLEDSYAPRPVIPFVRMQREVVRSMPGAQLMDNLLARYAGHPISYGKELDDAAFITHTSGTTKGIHKPVPLSDVGVNEGARRLLRLEEWRDLHHNMRIPMGMDLMLAYTLVDMVHAPLAAGGTVVTLFVNCLNPRFFEAVERYDINVLMTTAFMLDAVEERDVDLSNIEVTFVGGAYVSPTAKQHYDDVMRELGAKEGVSIGYGLSEVCGACVLASADRTDDAMGYLLPGVKGLIFDEDEEVLYDLDDGPRTGVLFLNSPSVSSGRVDDKTYFTLDDVDGEPYLNTFDLVHVNEDGSLTHAGRMNQYFVNDDGVRFDAGLVTGAISAQPHILACAIGPHYEKTSHETVPVLYVQVEGEEEAGEQAVRDALATVFVSDGAFEKTNLPTECVIMDSIPRNAAGKVDVRAAQANDEGARFKVLPVREDDRLVDVELDAIDDVAHQPTDAPPEVGDMLVAYAQVVPWFVPGGHEWYTTGDTKRKKQAFEKGVRIMTQFAQQMPPQPPKGMPFPMVQPPFAAGFGSIVPPVPQMPGQSLFPFPFPMPQPMPAFPFGIPGIPMPGMPGMPTLEGDQAPFDIPQPKELYEDFLKKTIGALQHMLDQSEGTRDEDDEESDETEASDDADEQESKSAGPASFMPDFGFPPMPKVMPSQPGQGPGAGVLAADNVVGRLFGSLFSASDTDYFYED